MKLTYIFHIALITFFVQCKSSQSQTIVSTNYTETAKKMLGDDSQCKMNESGTMSLCANENIQKDPSQKKFVVFSTETNEVLFQLTNNARVSWFGNDKLEIFEVPGIMKQGATNADYTYIYDIKSKTRVKKNAATE